MTQIMLWAQRGRPTHSDTQHRVPPLMGTGKVPDLAFSRKSNGNSFLIKKALTWHFLCTKTHTKDLTHAN